MHEAKLNGSNILINSSVFPDKESDVFKPEKINSLRLVCAITAKVSAYKH